MINGVLKLTAIVLTLVPAASAQQLPPPFPERDVVTFHQALPMPGGRLPAESALPAVQAALNLSEVQVTAVRTLLDMRFQSMQQTMEEMEAGQRKLYELMAEPNPNPTDVGNAFLTTRTSQEKLKAVSEKFRSDFEALLSADQRATLSGLKTAAQHIEALRMVGVLEAMFPPMTFSAAPFSGSIGIGDGLTGPGTRVERAIRIERRPPQNQ